MVEKNIQFKSSVFKKKFSLVLKERMARIAKRWHFESSVSFAVCEFKSSVNVNNFEL